MAFSRPIGVLLWVFPRRIRHALGALGHAGWFSAIWQRISAPLGASLMQAALLKRHSPRSDTRRQEVSVVGS